MTQPRATSSPLLLIRRYGDIWFAGDTHFGHKNIIHIPGRDHYSTVEQHDADIIDRWNSVVKPKDRVYHLGDVCFTNPAFESVKRLHGKKYLILGNHDNFQTYKYTDHFFRVHGCLVLFEDLLLTHVPVTAEALKGRFTYNIHGHTHMFRVHSNKHLNVCLEQNPGFCPIHIEDLMRGKPWQQKGKNHATRSNHD